MASDGWIKLHRKLLSDPLWKDCNSNQKVIMITLLLMANHKPNKWIFKGQEYEVKEGQFITSLKSIASESKCSPMVVRTALNKFEMHGFITNKSTNQNRLITIVNWGKYQVKESNDNKQSNKQVTSNHQASNKQVTTNKNDKNDKNVRNDIVNKFQPIIEAWNRLDKNIAEVQALTEGTARYKNLQARVNQYGEEKVLEAIDQINKSQFLKGYKTDFKITFDWFVKPNNFVKVLEGNYTDKDNHGHASEVEEKYKDLDDIWIH